jgi:hypothetical protein
MGDLIKGLQIISKYSNPSYPTHCEHDILYICVSPSLITNKKDVEELEELGFELDFGDDFIYSYKFGSA